MSYATLHPNHARKIASLDEKMCCVKNILEKIDIDINNLSSEEQTILNEILSDTNQFVLNTNPRNKTPNFIRSTSAGSIAISTYDVSIANVGATDGIVLGTAIRPGEILNFNAGSLNNIYPAGVFVYDATGTEFMIIYNS